MIDKLLLKEHCIAIIQNRMKGLQLLMKEAQDAANNETKSSSGDKYETMRAMNQLEKDMYSRQLVENTRELSAIMETNCELTSPSIFPGSFVRCDSVNFFLLAGLGKMTFQDELILVISPNAPLAKLMHGMQQGETFNFNNRKVTIEEVY